MAKTTKRRGRPEVEVKKDERIAARVTRELYDALQKRAYEENKSGSVILVEALIKFLDFKMPPIQKTSD